MDKLNLMVPQEGYSFADGESVLRAKPTAGPSRQRLDVLNAPVELGVSLVLEPDQYRYWRAFYRRAIAEGALPFLMDLVIDTPEVVEHEVKIIPGTVKTAGIQGDAHLVQFSLEVKMAGDDANVDDALVLLYGLYGDGAPAFLNELAALVNIHIPGAVA